MSQSIDLGPVIRAVRDEISGVGVELSREITRVDGHVGQVAKDLSLTSTQLRELKSAFDQYVAQAAKVAAVQQSETRVGNLKADLDRKYGHYSTVRRTSVGLLQAFDVGNVSKTVTAQVSEELMLQTPRYWLAPALVGLAAWANDDQDMAEKSIQEAYARDRAKTSLFFTIILRRQGRLDGAVRWLKHYLDAQDPSRLGREFAIILEATSYNAFGPAAQQLMSQRLSTWVTQLRNSEEIVEQQIARWVGEIGSQTEQLAPGSYQNLSTLSPRDWPRLKAQLEAATALPVMTDKYTAVANVDAQMPTMLENLMDDLVDRLVTEYDEEELPLRRDVLYHESVIEELGDVDLARQRADQLQQALDDSTDAVSMQTQTAITPELLGVSTQTQRVAIGAGQPDFRTAVGRFCASYRSASVRDLELVFNKKHSEYAREYSFVGCKLSTSTREEEGIEKLRSAWDRTMAAAIENNRFNNSWYTKRALIAAVIAVVIALINPVFGIAAALIGGGTVWYLGDQEKKKCDAAVRAIEASREKAVQVSIAKYRNATAEHIDALELYRSLDQQEPDLLALVDTWPTAQRTDEEASA